MAETSPNPVDAPEATRPSRAPREPLWRDALGERLRSARRERGETLSETADRAGISPQYLSEMERGIKEPSSEMIAAVAGALDTTLGDLALQVAERILLDRSVIEIERAVADRAAPPSGPVCRAAYALAA
ncbi:Helix-turn-helix domain-containing protein [Glycomyces sambucus]|uniref:Helix-turn-helix domain-containing protein n=1 Tax=Glycomyces sambucus TaxID=380244 RepID=A0A1G9EZA6_9ACTN|nr:helix-turn-helix transcriptional regulator [Glycomyces sambucus]SDK81517.1 Helix-turn-helix domain-containing protein [Glycomyces sambucus]